mmetsp:Transcript_75412/g.67692  ORF Transcript_75412/g.67692 Transcript_75412/m.67692 type:complete len:125 (+) Transcript_75412:110-484(+)
MAKDIEYSEKYQDDHFEYRHVILPKSLKSEIPRNRLMSEVEWREIGVTQSRGWMHYMIHGPEPHILLFRRPIHTDPRTGKAPKGWNGPNDLSEREKEFWIKDYNKNNDNDNNDKNKENKNKNNY